MINLYSWREDEVVPMLEEDEWEQVATDIKPLMQLIREYQVEHQCGLGQAKEVVESRSEDYYYELTGIRGLTYEVVYYRRRSSYGPVCNSCEKPYRTAKATYCVECGNKN